MLSALLLATLLVGATARSSSFPTAHQLTTEYLSDKQSAHGSAHGLTAPNPSLNKYFSPDTQIVCRAAPLPCAGEYTGIDGFNLLLHRFSSVFTVSHFTSEIIACTEGKSMCIIKLTMSGQTAPNSSNPGQAFQDMRIYETIEWNNVNRKIIKMDGAIAQLEDVIQVVMPKAAMHLYNVVDSVYKTTDADSALSAMDSLVADNIVINIDMTPSDVLSRTQYVGKQQFLELMKEVKELAENAPLSTLMQMAPVLAHVEILAANNDSVVYKKTQGKFVSIVTVQFDQAGQINRVDCWCLTALKPWDLYKGPVDVFEHVMKEIAEPFIEAVVEAHRPSEGAAAVEGAAGANRVRYSPLHGSHSPLRGTHFPMRQPL